MKEKSPDNRSAARALDILELFAQQRRPVFVTEMSSLLGLPLSSCYSLINTLESCGYAYSLGPRRGYYVTNKILRLANSIAAYDPLPSIFGPTLNRLRDETQETILLAQLTHSQIVVLFVCNSMQRISFIGEVGEIWPVHCSSMGRAILSAISEDERRAILGAAEKKRFNDKTVTETEQILRIVTEGHARGWHKGQGETVLDLMGIAVPIKVMGQFYAVAVTGPEYRISANEVEIAEKLNDARQNLLDQDSS